MTLLTALRKIINENIVIVNKYGFNSYLKENNDIYFLVNSLSIKGLFSSEYYTKFPTISDNLKLQMFSNPCTWKPYKLSGKFVLVQRKNIIEKLEKLPVQIKQNFLESSLLARKLNVDVNVNIRDIILRIYQKYYTEIGDVIISTMDENNKDV